MTNEAPQAAIGTTLTLKETGIPVFYDAMENTIAYPAYTEENGAITLQIGLDAYQSRFVILLPNEEAVAKFRSELPEIRREPMLSAYADEELVLKLEEQAWNVSASQAPETDVFRSREDITALGNLIVPGGPVDFTGTFRYEKKFMLEELPENQNIRLDLGRVYETAEVWINGQNVGSRIAPPYTFCVASALKKGENTICVDVTNTLVRQRGQNLLDRDMVQEPVGLLGPVRLFLAE